MHSRTPALPALPERPPYFTVKVNDILYTLRAPSPARVGLMLQRVPEKQRWQLITLPEMLAQGHSLFDLVTQVPDMLPQVAAVIGICWADPVWGFDAPPWTEGDIVAYGDAIYEELHEAGWTLDQIGRAAMAVADVVVKQSALSQEVREMTAFFRLQRDKTTESASESSSSTSTPTEGSTSTN